MDRHFRAYAKKGAKFADYQRDAVAQDAFNRMRNAVAEGAAIATIDYEAAVDPDSGRSIELSIDASDFAWGVTVAQRAWKHGPYRAVAVYNSSFTESEQAWSTFEGDLFGFREALAATNHLVKGFPVIA